MAMNSKILGRLFLCVVISCGLAFVMLLVVSSNVFAESIGSTYEKNCEGGVDSKVTKSGFIDSRMWDYSKEETILTETWSIRERVYTCGNKDLLRSFDGKESYIWFAEEKEKLPGENDKNYKVNGNYLGKFEYNNKPENSRIVDIQLVPYSVKKNNAELVAMSESDRKICYWILFSTIIDPSIGAIGGGKSINEYCREVKKITIIPVDEDGSRLNDLGEDYALVGSWGDRWIGNGQFNDHGYEFVGWKENLNGDYASRDNSYKVTKVRGDRTVYAVYRKIEQEPESELLETKLNIEASKNGGEYTDSDIYAKPGDSIDYNIFYYPGAQRAFEMAPSESKNGTIYICNGEVVDTAGCVSVLGSSDEMTWGSLFNMVADGMGSNRWNNRFSSTTTRRWWSGDIAGGNYIRFYDGNGVGSAESVNVSKYQGIGHSFVGLYLTETAATNEYDGTRTTPRRVRISDDIAIVDVAPITDSAHVYVPYNFRDSVELSGDIDGVLYAGEPGYANVKYQVRVNPKSNSIVEEGEYATMVRGTGSVKIRVCPEDDRTQCTEKVVAENQTWNSVGNLNGWESEWLGIDDVPIPDVPAGNKVCIAASVYPATSGGDTNLDPNGDYKWTSYNETCYSVAKKPNFQVWGGNVVANSIFAPFANKKLGDERRLFGSWGELAVSTLNGGNSTMASGATWGYDSNNDGDLQPNPYSTINSGNPGGGTMGTGCDSSILSFGSGCGLLGSIPGGSGEMDASGISKIAEQVEKKIGITGDANSLDYVYVVDEINLGEDEFVNGVRYFKNNGDIDINSDVKIERNKAFSKLEGTPQVVVYAGNNINIDCEVRRIDAILIAGGTINTCANKAEDALRNFGLAQTQLKINGAMYANTIKFNRTYGAATGANSIVPAEIVNYDNSMLFTGGSGTGTQTGGSMDVVYVRELAPRY